MITLQQHDFGFNLTITTSTDLTATTALIVVLSPPSGNPVIKHLDQTAIVSPALAGIIRVPIDPGDLSVAGAWTIQWEDVTPGRQQIGPVQPFLVLPNVPGLPTT